MWQPAIASNYAELAPSLRARAMAAGVHPMSAVEHVRGGGLEAKLRAAGHSHTAPVFRGGLAES